MAHSSFLGNIEHIKSLILDFANTAHGANWITSEAYNGIISSLTKEKIIIGVVGQMKNGKSTLINALAFGDQVLPSATTPMTSTLSFISHAAVEKVMVEFYSTEDWERIKQLAADTSDVSDTAESARMLTESAVEIQEEIPNLLSTSRTIKFEDLAAYTGANGRYVPITKSIFIDHPASVLKGVSIVDTPGFNDPVISREQRSREFLERADVVIVVLYAGRPLDAMDRSLLFEQVRTAGAGKAILLLNKYDTVINEVGGEEKVLEYVKKEINKTIDTIRKEDSIMAEIFQESKIIPFSSMFALLGKMSDEQISEHEELSGYYSFFKTNFKNLKKEDYIKFSKLPELEAEIEAIINKEKVKILIMKPSTELIGKMKEKSINISKNIFTLNKVRSTLSKDSSEIDLEFNNLKKIKIEIHDQVKKSYNEMQEIVKIKCSSIVEIIRDERDDVFKNISKSLPEIGDWQKNKSYIEVCHRVIADALIDFRKFINKTIVGAAKELHYEIKRALNQLDQKITSIIKNISQDNLNEIEYLKREFIQLFEIHPSEISTSIKIEISGFLGFWGVNRNKVIEFVQSEMDTRFSIDKLRGGEMVGSISNLVMPLIEQVSEMASTIINPITDALYDAKQNMEDKEKRAKEIDTNLIELEATLSVVDSKRLEFENKIKELTNEKNVDSFN